jgi:hypothetical protein
MSPEEKVGHIVHSSSQLISDEAAREVKHYYDHGEFEMAFEGLVLELMQANKIPSDYDYNSWCELARDLGLDVDSVFDGDFWPKFLAWGEKMATRERDSHG